MQQSKKELTPEELQHYKTADALEEVDLLKLRLLNRNVDFFTTQSELAQLKALEATRALMGLSNELARRYDFSDHRQIDANTGAIERDMEKLGISRSGDEQPQ